MIMSSSIAVSAQGPEHAPQAEQLAKKLGLPRAQPGRHYELLLHCCDTGLELVDKREKKQKRTVRVDFAKGQAAHRRRQQKKEMLVRAVGITEGMPPAVIDATGGLGRDSFILATSGCRVQTFEQVPLIGALLEDGLQRARLHPETKKIAERITLIQEDARITLQRMQRTGQKTDVVYLDPMFPKRQKSALVKKELQLLHILAKKDTQPDRLFLAALQAARLRVVVKRPVKSSTLTELPPSHSITGKTIRFDVYMI